MQFAAYIQGFVSAQFVRIKVLCFKNKKKKKKGYLAHKRVFPTIEGGNARKLMFFYVLPHALLLTRTCSFLVHSMFSIKRVA